MQFTSTSQRELIVNSKKTIFSSASIDKCIYYALLWVSTETHAKKTVGNAIPTDVQKLYQIVLLLL